MAAEFRRFQPSDVPAFRTLLNERSLDEFDFLRGPQGVDAWLADPFYDPELHWLAIENGALAGFASVFLLNARTGKWAMVRLGVRESSRRRGLGSGLIDRIAAGVDERHPDVVELATAYWQPAPAADPFAAAHGFAPARTFWQMERPRGASAEPEWPAGIRLAGHDGSERGYRDINTAYNDSFSRHYHSPVTTVEETRALFTRPGFRTDAYVLAYRGEEPAGFCRCEMHPSGRGEIAIVGTVAAARGIGLGRALLRWGVAWLERENAERITLVVDGENENALRLYRSEGFNVDRTRVVMSRWRPSIDRR
ncbi:MAG: GNAT family N-acetyltransferase [Candidatus Eiseniibacteriota bacterium]